jgi:hypothetical protein
MTVTVIAAVQVASAVALYRQRVIARVDGPDLIVLWLPFIVGALASYLVLTYRNQFLSTRTKLLSAGACALASFCLSWLINLNVFGS